MGPITTGPQGYWPQDQWTLVLVVFRTNGPRPQSALNTHVKIKQGVGDGQRYPCPTLIYTRCFPSRNRTTAPKGMISCSLQKCSRVLQAVKGGDHWSQIPSPTPHFNFYIECIMHFVNPGNLTHILRKPADQRLFRYMIYTLQSTAGADQRNPYGGATLLVYD